MRRLILALGVSAAGALVVTAAAMRAQPLPAAPLRIEVGVAPELAATPLDGRVLVIVSKGGAQEPRFSVGRGLASEPLFGVDIDGLSGGASSFVLQNREVFDSAGNRSMIPVRAYQERRARPAVIDATTRGWPVESLANIPAGDYTVQAVLNVYTTFHRADGHTIKAHMDQWEGQKWNRSPGNLYSEPQVVRIDPAHPAPVSITLTKKIPPIEPPADTTYVKHIKFKSDILSKWWGHDIDLGAIVVLPEGFDAHPDARYPVAYNQGHFPSTFAPGDRFLDDWKSGALGRFIILEEAAFLLKDFLDKADPPANATFDIGERAPHCYAGKPEFPGQRAEQRILPQMLDRMVKTAPPGADLKSWRY